MSPTVKPEMDYDVLDRYKWARSLDPGKDLEAILPLKKVLYDNHLQRIYEKWNGNSFKILLRDIVFLHNFFPSWTFMNVWLEGWSGSWILIYVVPMRRCPGRHFSIQSHLHAGSGKSSSSTGRKKRSREKHASEYRSLVVSEGVGAKRKYLLWNFLWKTISV